MKQRITLNVIEMDGKKYFRYKGFYFEALYAFPEFERGRGTLKRGGETVRRAEIHYFGTHGGHTCFMGLQRGKVTMRLFAEKFKVHDKIIITFDCEKRFDLLENLQRLCPGFPGEYTPTPIP